MKMKTLAAAAALIGLAALLSAQDKQLPPAAVPKGKGISAKEAAAIVQYRTEKGSFKEIADLKKVPDLDFQKIEAKKDRLAF